MVLSVLPTHAKDAVPASGKNVTSGVNPAKANGTNALEIAVVKGNADHSVDLSLASNSESSAGVLVLKAENSETRNLSVRLFDFMGELIVCDNLETSETHISIKDLGTGVYFLRVYNSCKEIKTFKITLN